MKMLLSATRMLIALTLLTGVLYPVAITAVGHFIFPRQAGGSVIVRNGRAVGSALIGQPFGSPRYFWSRPSATAPTPYNAAASSGSNWGPLHPALADSVRARIAALRAADSSLKGSVPVDLVTASASGLDPDVSVAAAEIQAPRIARERGLSPDTVQQLILRHTRGRTFGMLGEPTVNVLELNLDLDSAEKR
jgi:K+-transporting ATPase ATPase C chain